MRDGLLLLGSRIDLFKGRRLSVYLHPHIHSHAHIHTHTRGYISVKNYPVLRKSSAWRCIYTYVHSFTSHTISYLSILDTNTLFNTFSLLLSDLDLASYLCLFHTIYFSRFFLFLVYSSELPCNVARYCASIFTNSLCVTCIIYIRMR